MTKKEMSLAVLAAKKAKGLTWAELAEQVGLGEVWLASCGHGENCLDAESAEKLGIKWLDRHKSAPQLDRGLFHLGRAFFQYGNRLAQARHFAALARRRFGSMRKPLQRGLAFRFQQLLRFLARHAGRIQFQRQPPLIGRGAGGHGFALLVPRGAFRGEFPLQGGARLQRDAGLGA